MKYRFLFCFIFILSLLGSIAAQAKNIVAINFHIMFGGSTLLFDDSYYLLKNGDSIQFETFKLYISGLELINQDKVIWKEKNSFHLIDASNQKSLQFLLQTPLNFPFDRIKFNLGIDSLTNVSGAMGGDLDPTKGMYWTWQNGYINLKLEGHSNVIKNGDNEFQFHLGGYQYPFNSLQTIIQEVRKNEAVDIAIDLEKLMSEIDLTNKNHIMSPGKEAMLLSKKVSGIFSAKE